VYEVLIHSYVEIGGIHVRRTFDAEKLFAHVPISKAEFLKKSNLPGWVSSTLFMTTQPASLSMVPVKNEMNKPNDCVKEKKV